MFERWTVAIKTRANWRFERKLLSVYIILALAKGV